MLSKGYECDYLPAIGSSADYWRYLRDNPERKQNNELPKRANYPEYIGNTVRRYFPSVSYKKGEFIKHDKFGIGKVVANLNNEELVVDFDKVPRIFKIKK